MPRRARLPDGLIQQRIRIKPEMRDRVRRLSQGVQAEQAAIWRLALSLGLDQLDKEQSALGEVLDKRDTLGRLLESEEFRVGFVSMMSHSLDQLRRMPADRRPDVIVDHFHGEIDRYCGEARFSTDADVLESGRCEPAPGIVFQPSHEGRATREGWC